jgi:hypothetical protein
MTTTPFTGTLEFFSPINRETSFGQTNLAENTRSTIEVTIHADGSGFAEWDISELELTEEIGLRFEGNELTDYDGVFSLPSQLVKYLSDQGFDMSWAE